jgi:hypothetical protein
MGGVLRPGLLLRLEGAAVLVGAVVLYSQTGGNWLLFVLLILAPDLSALGYLAGPVVGSMTYNLIHTYVLPLGLVLYGWLGANPAALSVALIWLAHIGGDRLFGYGLKYPSGFRDNHLQRV